VNIVRIGGRIAAGSDGHGYPSGMGKGYAEGPAAEEAERLREELERGVQEPEGEERDAVFGATDDDPQPHFLGWAGELDPDELFRSGDAWAVSVRRVRTPI
jgi:hypothetical protein